VVPAWLDVAAPDVDAVPDLDAVPDVLESGDGWTTVPDVWDPGGTTAATGAPGDAVIASNGGRFVVLYRLALTYLL
jgi:hypothetical protein